MLETVASELGRPAALGSPTVEQLCLLDAGGRVVATSAVLETTGLAGGRHLVLSVGFGYRTLLEECAHGDAYAAAALSALDDVLSGRLSTAVLEYPCQTTDGHHWWRMQLTRLVHHSAVAAVVHEDVTATRQGALEHAASTAAGSGLGTSPLLMGTWSWVSASDELWFSEHVVEMFGLEPGRPYSWEDWAEWVVPEDRERILSLAREAFESGEMFEAEYRILPPGGELRTVVARGQAFCSPAGTADRMVGALIDVTATRSAQEGLIRSLEAMPAAFVTLDSSWRLTYVNAAAEILLDRPRSELLGASFWELYPSLVGTEFDQCVREASTSTIPMSFDSSFGAGNRCFAVTAHSSGGGVSLHFTDVTARRAAEAERVLLLDAECRARRAAEEASSRLRFLAGLSASLSVATTQHQVLSALAECALGVLGDWVVVYVPEDRVLRRVLARHRDPALDDFARTLVDAAPLPLERDTFAVSAFFSKEATLVPHVDEEALARFPAGAYYRALRILGDASGMVVPLVSRGEAFAVLVTGFVSHKATGADLELAVEAAARTAPAFDAAALVEQQTEVARALSRALLPSSLPSPEGWSLEAAYYPGTEGLEVGGDFYDAFEAAPGTLCVAVGDVSGHGLHAATVMGQVRTALRAYALSGLGGPAEVLGAVHRMVERFESEDLVTALVGHLDLATGVLSYASAGHLPFFVVSDGVATLIEGDPGLPLGVPGAQEAVRGSAGQVTLPPGARLFLYTDGLVERRDAGLDAGITRMMLLAERLYHVPLEDSHDRFFAELLRDGHEDDVCALALERLV